MSLLDDFAHKCILMEKKRTPDGAGGYITAWEEGAEFLNYQSLDTSMEARKAEKGRCYLGIFRTGQSARSHRVQRLFPRYGNGDYLSCDLESRGKAAPRSAGATVRALKFFTAERREPPK